MRRITIVLAVLSLFAVVFVLEGRTSFAAGSVVSLAEATDAGIGQTGHVLLKPGVPIYVGADEPAPVLRAVGDLQRDLEWVLGAASPIVHELPGSPSEPGIIVLGPASRSLADFPTTVEGWEAHRVYVESVDGVPHVVLEGADMRGAIYAIYTFSDEFLDIPPLWIWASWQPARKDVVEVPADTDLWFDPPYVQYRSAAPNDQDYHLPWRALSQENDEAWAETLLRLKMNTIVIEHILQRDALSHNARIAQKYGLVVSSPHIAPIGGRLRARWEYHWTGRKGQPAPGFSMALLDELVDMWERDVRLIVNQGIEIVWTATFRGTEDYGFWTAFPDAPTQDRERAKVIQAMLEKQVELIRRHTDEGRVIRIPLYNEMSDYYAQGLLDLPRGDDVVWNFVAARRDHYPPDGIRDRHIGAQRVGYYMNLQFTSTGSHIAQAEGPWKMEQNFRMIDALSDQPMRFSEVNVGNIREHVFEAAANAAMMWDFTGFDSDEFVRAFAERYFGAEHSDAVAKLYEDFYNAYWQQRPNTIEGFPRQFIFHDYRYSRAMRDLLSQLMQGATVEPLSNFDTHRISPSFHGVSNTLDALIVGTRAASGRFAAVAVQADRLLGEVPVRGRTFFNDNLRLQAHFMLAVNDTVHQLALAMRALVDRDPLQSYSHLLEARQLFERAKAVLAEAEHGRFFAWYRSTDRDLWYIRTIDERFEQAVRIVSLQLPSSLFSGQVTVGVRVRPAAFQGLVDRVEVRLQPVGSGPEGTHGRGGSVKIYDGPASTQRFTLDTSQYPDGMYELEVTGHLVNGQTVSSTQTVQIANWQTTVDDLLPPLESWFFTVDQKKTVAESEGWAYRTDQPELYFGDSSRLQRTGDDKEFLVWEAPHLRRIDVVLYSTAADVQVPVRIEVSSGAGDWHVVEHTVQVTDASPEGMYQIELSAAVPADQCVAEVKLVVGPGTQTPSEPQLGSVHVHTPFIVRGVSCGD